MCSVYESNCFNFFSFTFIEFDFLLFFILFLFSFSGLNPKVWEFPLETTLLSESEILT